MGKENPALLWSIAPPSREASRVSISTPGVWPGDVCLQVGWVGPGQCSPHRTPAPMGTRELARNRLTALPALFSFNRFLLDLLLFLSLSEVSRVGVQGHPHFQLQLQLQL